MKLTTMHHLGRRPGRARLGACGHLRTNPTPAVAFCTGNWTGSWQQTAPTPAAPATLTMGYVGTTDAGNGSIKPTTRHLGTRST